MSNEELIKSLVMYGEIKNSIDLHIDFNIVSYFKEVKNLGYNTDLVLKLIQNLSKYSEFDEDNLEKMIKIFKDCNRYFGKSTLTSLIYYLANEKEDCSIKELINSHKIINQPENIILDNLEYRSVLDMTTERVNGTLLNKSKEIHDIGYIWLYNGTYEIEKLMHRSEEDKLFNGIINKIEKGKKFDVLVVFFSPRYATEKVNKLRKTLINVY